MLHRRLVLSGMPVASTMRGNTDRSRYFYNYTVKYFTYRTRISSAWSSQEGSIQGLSWFNVAQLRSSHGNGCIQNGRSPLNVNSDRGNGQHVGIR